MQFAPPPRSLIVLGGVALVLFVAGMAGLDEMVAPHVHSPVALNRFLRLVDILTLKIWSNYLLPLVLIAGGGAVWLGGRKPLGRALLYVGLVQLILFHVVESAKPVFGRLRPFEVADSGWVDVWHAGGSSFASAHTAFFAGLIVPIVFLWPRAWPLLVIPLLVAVQRVVSTDHWLSDSAASLVYSVILAWALQPVARGMHPRVREASASE